MLKRLKNISLKRSLLIALAYYAILGVIVLVSYFLTEQNKNKRTKDIIDYQGINVEYISIFNNIYFSNDLIHRYFQTQKPSEKEYYSSEIQKNLKFSIIKLDKLQKKLKNDKELNLYKQSYFLLKKIQDINRLILNEKDNNGITNKLDIFNIQLFKLKKLSDNITKYYNKEINKLSKNRFKSSNKIILFIIIFALSVFVTFFYIIFFIKNLSLSIKLFSSAFNRFLQGKGLFIDKKKVTIEFYDISDKLNTIDDYFKQIRNSVYKLAQNDFSETNLVVRNDYLSESISNLRLKMADNQKKITKQQIEAQQRDWINSGLANFNEILRKYSGQIDELSSQVITTLVKYLSAIQGGMFIVSEEDNHVLELKASFAFNRKKYIEKQVKFGDGLVGTAVIEKRTIYLTELPADYLEITSGLGDAKPVSLLIVPLNRDNDIHGAFEISSFQKLEDFQIEFVQKVAELTALTLNNESINNRTKKLLEESQRKSDELATQEEEMRQNLEELRAIQEEAKNKERKIENVLESTEKGFRKIVFTPNKIVKEANKKLLGSLQIAFSTIRELNIEGFINPTTKNILDIWDEALLKNSVTFDFTLLSINRTFIGTFIPIYDIESGELIEMHLFISNITKLHNEINNLNSKIQVLNHQILEYSESGRHIDEHILGQKAILSKLFKTWNEHISLGTAYQEDNKNLQQNVAQLEIKIEELTTKIKNLNKEYKGKYPDDDYSDWLNDI